MRKLSRFSAVLVLIVSSNVPGARAAGDKDATSVAQLLAEGDRLFAKKQFEKAMDAYKRADKDSHHTCAPCFLRMVRVEKYVGELSAALDDAKQAVKAAGDDKKQAAMAHMIRGTLLAQMAGKSKDKKLKDAEDEFRQALALDPTQVSAHYSLGFILMRQERDADGIAELNAYLASPEADAKTIEKARTIIADPIRAREPFAPDFSFVTLEGETVSNSALRGKVVLLDFWGTWCPPCRESVPTLVSLHKKFSEQNFQIVGVSSDTDEDKWKTFIAEKKMAWPEYIDLSGSVESLFEVHEFPTYVVIDRNGVIQMRQSGLDNGTGLQLEDAINKALKKPYNPEAARATAAKGQN
ncbi:MAG TPA: redoxin family protein [Candidatus Sulfotelmatobacter sp.]|nr:redoxin family protein [Candidatus Sulfotelmatobacter sp.]